VPQYHTCDFNTPILWQLERFDFPLVCTDLIINPIPFTTLKLWDGVIQPFNLAAIARPVGNCTGGSGKFFKSFSRDTILSSVLIFQETKT
jgi:hypothetical protein